MPRCGRDFRDWSRRPILSRRRRFAILGRSAGIFFSARAAAMSAVAAAAELDADKKVKQARLVLGGVATIPWRVQAAEAHLAGKTLSEDVAAQAAKIALEGAKPMGQNGYKIPLTQTLVRRAL